MSNTRPNKHRIAPRMTERARGFRKEAPLAERILWGMLRGKQLGGFKFRRQHVSGRYVTDNCCPEVGLVVELDGLSHVGQAEADERRTSELERQGLTVFRVTNDDLLAHPDAVFDAILAALTACQRSKPGTESVVMAGRPTLPQPLPEREGGRTSGSRSQRGDSR